ncbi:MAG: haloacid dehalogenase-like hydrolase [Myxococcaceae bacterium]|nr:haloacid dehalogenase-like hydrolase [Myxococcaceae bacterium]
MRTLLVLLVLVVGLPAAAQTDPLPSWNEGPAKQAILGFVRATTEKRSPQYVPPEQRIATFDQDGTLWVEQPLYTQLIFALDRVKALAPQHPEWKTQEPFKTILSGDPKALETLTVQDIERVVAVTSTGMTVEAFNTLVTSWFATAKQPRFGRPYLQLVYQPMLELLRYLRANGYKTYIVTGGGQDFVRVYSEQVYGVPPEQVMGTAGKTQYGYQNGQPVLIKLPEVLLVDDKTGKPEGIHLLIGRKPKAAFGNSDGDQQMLEWAQASGGAPLMMLVHHDDAEREYAYGPASRIGTFSDALMAEAKKRGWTVISMKKDWKRIFPFEEK